MRRYICYFTGGRSVSGKTLPEVLKSGEGRAFKTEGKVFLDTDRPRPGNNIFIFLLSFTNENRTVCRDVCMPSAGLTAEKSDKCQLRIQD